MIVVLALALVGAVAPPAAAEPPVTLFASPGDDEVVTVATPVIAGEVRMTNGILLEDVLVEVVSKWDHPGASTVVRARALGAQTFSFSPTLAYNGPYQAIVTATGKDLNLDIRTDTAVASRSFTLAVPPEVPADVKASVDPDTRAATVSWRANPEPDIIGYQVRRSRGSDSGSTVVGTTSETSFVDTGAASAGGDHTYRVYAVRVGGSAESGIMSAPSPAVTVTIPDALGRASSPARGAPVAPSSGSPATSAPSRPAPVDLSKFRALVAEEDDIYTEYGTGVPGSDKPVFPPGIDPSVKLPDDALVEQVPGGVALERTATRRDPPDVRRSWSFVAAGLLAGVLAGGGLWLRREVAQAPPL